MWVFSTIGFYSVACANKPDGTIDPDRVMVRARVRKHLINLQKRFPTLAGKILALPRTDYSFRLIVPKAVWAEALKELAMEQTWSNFKNEATSRTPETGDAYVRKLHDVWWEMLQLQEARRKKSQLD